MSTNIPGHDIIVIGASMGGVEALIRLAAQFPEDLPASIFVVNHVSPHSKGILAQLLDRSGLKQPKIKSL